MQSFRSRAQRRLVVSSFALVALASPQVAEAARRAPTVEQMVVFKSGRATVRTVKAAGLRVSVGSRRASVRTGTPLAALERSRPGRIGLRSFSGQLYVRSISSDRARGQSGWLYKVGNKLASAGAADPSGPFGSGLLRTGQKVTWYYGSLEGVSGPRTLTLKVSAGPAPGTARASVRSYDDEGRGRPEPGVTVKVAGGGSTTTATDGSAVVAASTGLRRFTATKATLIRSFPVKATVR